MRRQEGRKGEEKRGGKRRGGIELLYTLLRKPAYPPLILPRRSLRTARRISPQNFTVPSGSASFLLLILVSELDGTKSRCALEVPPISLSTPNAYLLRSSLLLKERRVMGPRLSSFSPSMRMAFESHVHQYMTNRMNEG